MVPRGYESLRVPPGTPAGGSDADQQTWQQLHGKQQPSLSLRLTFVILKYAELFIWKQKNVRR